jgi:hypothetical protein
VPANDIAFSGERKRVRCNAGLGPAEDDSYSFRICVALDEPLGLEEVVIEQLVESGREFVAVGVCDRESRLLGECCASVKGDEKGMNLTREELDEREPDGRLELRC